MGRQLLDTPLDTPMGEKDLPLKDEPLRMGNIDNRDVKNEGGVLVGNIYGYNLIIGSINVAIDSAGNITKDIQAFTSTVEIIVRISEPESSHITILRTDGRKSDATRRVTFEGGAGDESAIEVILKAQWTQASRVGAACAHVISQQAEAELEEEEGVIDGLFGEWQEITDKGGRKINRGKSSRMVTLRAMGGDYDSDVGISRTLMRLVEKKTEHRILGESKTIKDGSSEFYEYCHPQPELPMYKKDTENQILVDNTHENPNKCIKKSRIAIHH
ncbi:hypothetical protein GGR51DRAFT_556484 [Nemania sp. FL0031]|nr:hypothetical protein GGR51DRAFT_556484 [Nemania sp. FL0031]